MTSNYNSAALMTMVAFGEQNARMGSRTPNERFDMESSDYTTENFNENNFLRISSSCDKIVPEYLEFELAPNYNIENIHKACFEMCIANNGFLRKILDIPLRFFMLLNNYEICDNKLYIQIPFEMFCDKFSMLSLPPNVTINFSLNGITNDFLNCKLIIKRLYFDADVRRELARNQQTIFLQQLSSVEIYAEEPKNIFKFKAPFEGIHKGFYIECENVDNINNIQIKLNLVETPLIDYGRFLVKKKCVKVNSKLLYVPFNYEKSQNGRNISDFFGSVNLARIDRTILNIKLDNPISKICIYGLGSNVLDVSTNTIHLHFNYSMGHHYLDYRENGIYINNDGIYFSSDSSFHHISNIVYKQITDQNKIQCCIEHDDISSGARYMSCIKCHNNYNETALKAWFQNKTRKTCPMCRETWTDFTTFINDVNPSAQVVETPAVTYRLGDPYLESTLNPPTSA